MAQAALKTFSISTRHWLPMKELERAIFNFVGPPERVAGRGELPQAVEINSTAAAAAMSRTYRCTLIAAPPCFTATGHVPRRAGLAAAATAARLLARSACGHGGQGLAALAVCA